MNLFSRQVFKEPLFQFLIIGLVLLGGERLINAKDYSDDQYSIFIDDQLLAQFMQREAKSFKPEDALKAIQGLPLSERQRLIERYVQSEVLYREALGLNLERDDQIIRRRLMQKMDYLAQGFYDEKAPLTEVDLRAYYDTNREDYIRVATATFTHVFVASGKDLSWEKGETRALKLLKGLNAGQVPFENSGLYGERFLYNRNYVNRDDEEIASHFGLNFKQEMFSLVLSNPPDSLKWQGPLKSNYGWHLVLVTKKTPMYIPEFQDVSAAVLADAQRQQQREIKQLAIKMLISKYQIIDKTEPK
jgi:hypothetical protein